MSDNKNKGDKVRPSVQWTAEDRARHQPFETCSETGTLLPRS